MKWLIVGALISLLSFSIAQQLPAQSLRWRRTNQFEGRQGFFTDVNDVQVPNFITTGVQIAKQVPYVEVIKLIEAFLRLKGEVAGRVWTLLYDNGHIFSALRDTLISKISTIHNLTLTAVIILRKVMEFASSLLSNANIRFGR